MAVVIQSDTLINFEGNAVLAGREREVIAHTIPHADAPRKRRSNGAIRSKNFPVLSLGRLTHGVEAALLDQSECDKVARASQPRSSVPPRFISCFPPYLYL